jgi:uroporphyrinogen-III synthase
MISDSQAAYSPDIDFMHELASQMSAADPLHKVLARVVEFATTIVKCDSCLVYALDGDDLVLRASMNPHPEVVGRLKLREGLGSTGWATECVEPVAIAQNAFEDPRFRFFNELPEDRYEAFLSVPALCHGHLVGVINLQHHAPHVHTEREIRLVSTIAFLAGAEIEMARLEGEKVQLSQQLEARKVVERAKGILQRDLGLSEEEAYLALQRQSRQRRTSMKKVAEAIVLSEDVKRSSPGMKGA